MMYVCETGRIIISHKGRTGCVLILPNGAIIPHANKTPENLRQLLMGDGLIAKNKWWEIPPQLRERVSSQLGAILLEQLKESH